MDHFVKEEWGRMKYKINDIKNSATRYLRKDRGSILRYTN